MSNCCFHFIGIGGISMSGLAKLLFLQGISVQGSDRIKSDNTQTLKKLGVKVFIGHNAENVQNADIVIYNSAIDNSNPEMIYARKKKLPMWTRAELLGKIATNYKNVIAISGAHGKTTTTSMIGEIFLRAGLEPTIHCGGVINSLEDNIHLGNYNYFITEACEYKDSFLTLKPTTSVILNIAEEHLDYFKNINNIQKSFNQFAKNSGKVVCESPLNYENSITFGENGDYVAKNIKYGKKYTKFIVYKNKKKFAKILLKTHGEYNVRNALASIIVADHFNIDIKIIKEALKNFSGNKRRFEIIKRKPLIIHDYAHHPAEIECSIKTMRQIHRGKLLVVFQPHTYTRTKKLLNDFVSSLSLADKIVIVKTYPAREKYDRQGSAKTLYEAVLKNQTSTTYAQNLSEARNYIRNNLKGNNCVLILGAGDIEKICKSLK